MVKRHPSKAERTAIVEARMEKIIAMVEAGVAQSEMAKRLDVSGVTITKSIQRARDLGRLPPREPVTPQAKLNNELKKFEANRGTVSQMMLLMPEPARAWVMSNVPENATIADFAASVLLDAYYDEMGG